MIINIRDPQTLRQINPISVSTYLQQNGWHEQQHVEDKVASWTKAIKDNEQVEISLPLDPNFADFHFRISEILQTLAIVEHRLPEEIFNDLVSIITKKTEANIRPFPRSIELTADILVMLIRFVLSGKSYKMSMIVIFTTIVIMNLIILRLALQGADIPGGLIICLLVFSMLAFLGISFPTTDSIIDLEEDEI
jgi:hypothetical protein